MTPRDRTQAQPPQAHPDAGLETLQWWLGQQPQPEDGERPLAGVEWQAAIFAPSDAPADLDFGAFQQRLAQLDLPAPAAREPATLPKRRWRAKRLGRPRLPTLKRATLMRAAALCVCTAILGTAAIVYRATRTAAPAPAVATLAGNLPIDVVKSARVGDAINVTVGPVAAADGLPVTLAIVGSYGPRVYRAAFAGGTARVQIPGTDTQQSGTATLIATAGSARGEAAVTFAPGPPVDPVTPLVGARSITADTQHWSMAVVVPFDSFGNPVAEGTPVELRALHPGDQLELQHINVHNQVAWAQIYSRTQAGRTTVSVTARGKNGPDATFTEVPGWPIPYSISASPANVPADGRQFVTLRTDVIRDGYGNPMLDGTLVTFVVDTPGGEPRFIPAYTLDGVAKAQLQAPREPGAVTVHAVLYDTESRPLGIEFAAGPAVSNFPVTARVNAAEKAIELEAGPLLGALQQFIPDGTPVEFVLTDPAGQNVRVAAIAEGGYARAEARLAELRLGAYSAEVTVGTGHGSVSFQVP